MKAFNKMMKGDMDATTQEKLKLSNDIELVKSGEDFFKRLIWIISQAQTEIHLQTYIFENDSTGKNVANALKEAALRKVKVYVLLDGYGSLALSKQFVNDMKKSGVTIRFFSPFHSSNNIYIGRRLHHKIVVVDGTSILIGGINIADKYRGSINKEPWLDFAVKIKNGIIGGYLQQMCRNIYHKKKKVHIKKLKQLTSISETSEIRILINDWLKRKNEIRNAYLNAINNSKNEVIIIGSYFLPGRRLINALKKASKKGVKINLILSGISDVPFFNRATKYLYASLLKHQIKIYEWDKSVLHGKASAIDNEWVTIGSFNLNQLSYYGSIEMNVEIYSEEFSKNFSAEIEKVIGQCQCITYQSLFMKNGIIAKTLNWLAYSFVRILLIIATYLPYKRVAKLY